MRIYLVRNPDTVRAPDVAFYAGLKTDSPLITAEYAERRRLLRASPL